VKILHVAQYVLERKIVPAVGNAKNETFYTWGTILCNCYDLWGY